MVKYVHNMSYSFMEEFKMFWKHFSHRCNHLYLVQCGNQIYQPNQSNFYTVQTKFVIHFIINGSGYLKIKNKNYSLKTNMGFILHQGEQVKYGANHDNPWQLYWVGIGGDDLDYLLSETNLLTNNVLHFSPYSQSNKTLQLIVDYNMSNPSDDKKVEVRNQELIYRLLYDLIDEYANTDCIDYVNQASDISNNIYQYIQEHYFEDITVAKIADIFSLSHSSLYRLSNDKFGIPPKQVIQNIRMQKAAELLLTTKANISDLARQVGYKDSFTFSKYFKKHFKYSPTKFKKLDEHIIEDLLFNRWGGKER